MAAPTKPRDAKGPFSFFVDSEDDKLEGAIADRAGVLARRWQALDGAARKVYEDLAAEDAARYACEKAAYDDANKEKPPFVAKRLPPRKPPIIKKKSGGKKERRAKKKKSGALTASLKNLAVGDRVTMDGALGSIEELPGLTGWWKVRLDGDGTVRSVRSGKFAPAPPGAAAEASTKKRGLEKAPAAVVQSKKGKKAANE